MPVLDEQRRRVARHVLGLADARDVHAPAGALGREHELGRGGERGAVEARGGGGELARRDLEEVLDARACEAALLSGPSVARCSVARRRAAA